VRVKSSSPATPKRSHLLISSSPPPLLLINKINNNTVNPKSSSITSLPVAVNVTVTVFQWPLFPELEGQSVAVVMYDVSVSVVVKDVYVEEQGHQLQ
jgi:hypothetical protein